MRYFIELAYKGTRFHGWQRQPDAITVQEVLEKSLSTKLNQALSVVGAGRTDTGVHASFFVAHFETDTPFDIGKTIFGLNHLVGEDIVIFDIYPVSEDKHARFDASLRTYEYRITPKKNPFLKDVSTYFPKSLNIDLMNEASKILLRYRDFTSFSKLHTDTKTNNCLITEAFWREENDLLIFKISADRFLRNMVRAIVGTLIEVGLQKIDKQEFIKIIESKNRSKAGTSVPAQGLFLIDIKYDFL